MPVGAEIISVQMQNGTPCIWAIVPLGAPTELRSFITIGTGHDFEDAFTGWHIATYQTGPYVWHVFEFPTPKPQN